MNSWSHSRWGGHDLQDYFARWQRLDLGSGQANPECSSSFWDSGWGKYSTSGCQCSQCQLALQTTGMLRPLDTRCCGSDQSDAGGQPSNVIVNYAGVAGALVPAIMGSAQRVPGDVGVTAAAGGQGAGGLGSQSSAELKVWKLQSASCWL